MQRVVSLGTDYLLQQPIGSLIDEQFVVGQITTTLTKMIEGEESERWLKSLLETIEYPTGYPKDFHNHGSFTTSPDTLAQPITIEQSIMKHLFQHSLDREFVSSGCISINRRFYRRLKTLTTSAPQSVSKGFSALRGLRDKR